MANASPLSLEDMLQTISAGLKQQVDKPNIFGYTPHAKQDDFHHADTKGRLYIGGNRCLAEGTLVLMADGSTKPIEKIKVGDYVISGEGTRTRVEATWDNGLKECYDYSIGRYQDVEHVVCTPDHKFWSALEKHGTLKPFMKHPVGRLLDGRGRHKIQRSQGTDLGGINEPRAYVLGLMLGDGYVGHSTAPSQLQFTCADGYLIDEVSEVFKATEQPIQWKFREPKKWFDWFNELGIIGCRSETKFIPEEVWNWNEESIRELLIGLIETDGSFFSTREGDYHMTYCSNSKLMIEQFRQLMGIRFGVWGSTILFESRGTYYVSYGTREALEIISSWDFRGVKAERSAVYSFERNSFSSRVGVKKATPVGLVQTYDITVAHESHTFMLANGIITSNSGKSYASVAEDVWWLTNTHPYIETPEAPIRGRVVTVDFVYGLEQIIIPLFKILTPKRFLKNGSWDESYSKQYRTLTLTNGSTCEFMSYEQDTEKFAGTSRHFCVDENVRILTRRGWVTHEEMQLSDEILTINPDTRQNEWKPLNFIYRGVETNGMVRLRSRNNFDVMVTPDHRWYVYNKKTRQYYFTTTKELKKSEQIIILGSGVDESSEIYSDDFIRLVGWTATDGSFAGANQITITQSWKANPENVDSIEAILMRLNADYKEFDNNGAVCFYLRRGQLVENIKSVMTPTRAIKPEFLSRLSTRQLNILLESILDGDGCRLNSGKIMIADDLKYPERMDTYAMLLTMLGRRAMYSVGVSSNSYQMLSKTPKSTRYCYDKVSVDSLEITKIPYQGVVWCPNTDNGTFYGIKDGKVFLTGNCHYDEEPPLHVFNECNARLVDTNGRWWISMTPVEGLTWTFEKIYEVGKANPDRINITEADMLDNPHITKEAAEDYLSGLDDDERKAREHGTYVQLGGLVYKQFSIERHVVPIQIPPKNWLWYVSLDHGFNNPTGVLWHAVSPQNTIITFAEYYERERTLDENAAAIKAKNKAFGKEPDFYVADPAIAQRSAHSGTSIQTEYAMRGLPFALGSNNVETGVAKVQAYLRNIPGTDTPRRVITENCEAFITEMRKLRWKTYTGKKMQFDNNPQEKIHKKDDHLCDSDRYFHTFLPDLAPAPPPPVGLGEAPVEAHGGHRPVYGGIDEVLKAMGKMDEVTGEFDWKITYGTDLSGLEYE